MLRDIAIAIFVGVILLVFGCSDKRSPTEPGNDILKTYTDLSKFTQVKLNEAQKLLDEARTKKQLAEVSGKEIKEANNNLLIKEQQVTRLKEELIIYAGQIESYKHRLMTSAEREQHEARTKDATAIKEKQQRLAMCVSDLSAVIDNARAYIVGGYYRDALEKLAECNDRDADPAIKSAYQKTLNDAKKGLQNEDQATKKTAAKKQLSIQAEKKSKGVFLGMSQQDVLESSWGKPKKINRTILSSGVHEQWVYDGNYLYFNDDVLIAIQN